MSDELPRHGLAIGGVMPTANPDHSPEARAAVDLMLMAAADHHDLTDPPTGAAGGEFLRAMADDDDLYPGFVLIAIKPSGELAFVSNMAAPHIQAALTATSVGVGLQQHQQRVEDAVSASVAPLESL